MAGLHCAVQRSSVVVGILCIREGWPGSLMHFLFQFQNLPGIATNAFLHSFYTENYILLRIEN